MKKIAVYAGTFDPLTYGHLDVIERASKIFPQLIIGVAISEAKSPLFSLNERLTLVKESVHHLPEVKVKSFDGLLVDLAESEEAKVIVRGLRAFSDFEYEFQMALTNRTLKPGIETLFLMPKQDYSYVSSSNVREVAKMGGDISQFVPLSIQNAFKEKFS
jgi:pantetheine-phosphate adenylyltransferase